MDISLHIFDTNQCDHDNKGDFVYQSASGKLIYWFTYIQWASYCSDARAELIYDYHDFIDDPIVMATCTCSKCGSWAINESLREAR